MAVVSKVVALVHLASVAVPQATADVPLVKVAALQARMDVPQAMVAALQAIVAVPQTMLGFARQATEAAPRSMVVVRMTAATACLSEIVAAIQWAQVAANLDVHPVAIGLAVVHLAADL